MRKGIILSEAGAVLNKKNKTALRQAFETIRAVLSNAGIDLANDDSDDDTDDKDDDPKPAASTSKTTKEAAGFSIADLSLLLQAALDNTRPQPIDPDVYTPPLRIVDIFDASFVYTEGWSSSQFYSVDYSVTDDGVVTLGTPTFVIRKVNYIAPGANAREAASGNEGYDLLAIPSDPIKLVESAIAADGTARIKLIDADRWGASGYYSADVLRRDGALAFPQGTKMYIDHDTPAEAHSRPEGTITRLAAHFEEAAQFVDDPKHGAGLYARIKVRDLFRTDLDDIADVIGTSICAEGKAQNGTAQGVRGPIITALKPSKFNRVDFVTLPGAGGKILPLFESLRSRAALVEADTTTADNHTEDQTMTDEQIREAIAAGIKAGLDTALAPVSQDVARLRETLALRDASDVVTAHLATINGLPRATRDRLVPMIAREAVIDQATGAIDRAKLIETADRIVRDEAAYISSIGGARIVGLGESLAPNATPPDPAQSDADAEAELAGIFGRWGLSEAAAKTAARGRVQG